MDRIRARIERAERQTRRTHRVIERVLRDTATGDFVSRDGTRYTAAQWEAKRLDPPPNWGSITRYIVRPGDTLPPGRD